MKQKLHYQFNPASGFKFPRISRLEMLLLIHIPCIFTEDIDFILSLFQNLKYTFI